MGFQTPVAPTLEELNSCVQCGLCLPHCPTYRLTGLETESPRGRIMAMRAVYDGRSEIDASFTEVIDHCLGCRACEPVCPGLVPYGRLLEGTRAELVNALPNLRRDLVGQLVSWVLPFRPLARLSHFLLSRRQRHVNSSHPLTAGRQPSTVMGRTWSGLRPPGPRTPPTLDGVTLPSVTETRGRVGLLTGCIMSEWFGSVHQATIGVVRSAGFDIAIPTEQTCCGALSAHAGQYQSAQRMARRNQAAFAEVDLIVANAAGCSAHLKHYPSSPGAEKHAGQPISADKTERTWSDRARDICELMGEWMDKNYLPVLPPGRGKVAVQEPCHLRHGQRVHAQLTQIVSAAGYEPVIIDESGMCCGAAGTYSWFYPQTSAQLGQTKATEVHQSGATIVTSANPGCEMQLRTYLGDGFRILHPVELYWEQLVNSRLSARIGTGSR